MTFRARHDESGENMKLALTLVVGLSFFSLVASAQPVRICDDSRAWPPYSYVARIAGKADASQPQGAMIDLIAKIFQTIALDYSITTMPWKRCLHEVATFEQRQNYEIAIEGTLNAERLHNYYITPYLYTTTGGYWYSKTQFPQGPVVNSPDDLRNYKLCGIHGYNYTGYRITDDVLIATPPNYQAAFHMVSSGRCDLFLSNIPTPLGKVKLGELTIPTDVVGKKVPQLPSGTFHIFIAKSSPRAQELLTRISQAIHLLNYQGITDKIFYTYLPTCGRHC
jgi:polar amino acid transport system substrate-binding protein